MPYATLNGIRMHYDSHGEGDPVLLISGLSAPSANWLFQVKGLSPRYRVITFDKRIRPRRWPTTRPPCWASSTA